MLVQTRLACVVLSARAVTDTEVVKSDVLDLMDLFHLFSVRGRLGAGGCE